MIFVTEWLNKKSCINSKKDIQGVPSKTTLLECINTKSTKQINEKEMHKKNN